MQADIALPTHFNVYLQIKKSSAIQRAVAYLIDWGAKFFYVYLLSNSTNFNFKTDEKTQWFTYLINILFGLPFYAYTPLLEYFTKGRTLGKIALGIKVVGENGVAPSAAQCLIRWLFNFADFYALIILVVFKTDLFYFVFISPLIGFLVVVFSKNAQRLGDIAANTHVVAERQKQYTLEDTLYAYAREENKSYEAMFPQIIKLSDKDMTLVKELLERSEGNYDLAEKLSLHVQKILNIDTNMEYMAFLRQILRDYNYLSQKK